MPCPPASLLPNHDDTTAWIFSFCYTTGQLPCCIQSAIFTCVRTSHVAWPSWKVVWSRAHSLRHELRVHIPLICHITFREVHTIDTRCSNTAEISKGIIDLLLPTVNVLINAPIKNTYECWVACY